MKIAGQIQFLKNSTDSVNETRTLIPDSFTELMLWDLKAEFGQHLCCHTLKGVCTIIMPVKLFSFTLC